MTSNSRTSGLQEARRRIAACGTSGSYSVNLGHLGLADVPEELFNVPDLTSLSLDGNNIGDAGARVIAERLTGLTSLSLDNNNISDAGVRVIAERLTGLTSLSLDSNNISDAGARVIAERLTGLTSLSLDQDNISDVGAQAIAERLTGLTSLSLDNNNIGDAGARVIAERLTGLTSLSLGGDNIGDVAARNIAERLPSLTSLSLGWGSISEAGARAIAERLANLTSLDLKWNEIGDAGAQAIAEHLPGLTSLDLEGNTVETAGARAIAERLLDLTSLKLGWNGIGELGARAIAGHLASLTSLSLESNDIGDAGARAIAERLTGLISLSLDKSDIGDAGARAIAERLTELSSLHLGWNNIGEAGARAIAEFLPRLSTLSLYDNNIGDAGARAIAERLTGLTSLSLGDNHIGEAGARAIAEGLTGLTLLSLNTNNIGDAGAQAIAERLTGLTFLRLEKNHIGGSGARAIAERITGLTFLSLDWNDIGDVGARAIAERLKGLTSLGLEANSIGEAGARALLDALSIPTRHRVIHTLNLKNNRIENLPKEVLDTADAQAILAAWRRFNQSQKRGELVPLNEAKILVVGDEAVGKTSLIRFLVYDVPCQQQDRTVGIEKTPWTPPGTAVKANVWDFAGQEITHGTHQYFLTERSLYLLVLSDRKQDDRSIYRWLPIIRARAGDAPIIVAINQSDGGKEHLVMQWDEIRKQNPEIVAVCRTSCSDDDWARQSVAALREKITDTLNTSLRLKEIRDGVPTSWMRVKQRLTEAAQGRSVLEHSDFVTECMRQATKEELSGDVISDRDEQRQLLRTLHNLGVVIVHGLSNDSRDIPPNLEILDPNWLTQAIYRILQHEELRNSHGVFAKTDLGRWLDPVRYPAQYHDEVLKLLQDKSIELAVALDAPGKYLVPQALPPTDINWDNFLIGKCLSFAYQYNPMPNGLLARFIVRTFAHSKDPAARTRYGVMLEVDGCPVHAGVNERLNLLTMRVGGDARKRVRGLAYVRGTMQQLHHIFGIQPDELVPLPDRPEVRVPYQYLRDLEKLKGLDHKFLPPGALQEYSVRELVEGIMDEDKGRKTDLTNETKARPPNITPIFAPPHIRAGNPVMIITLLLAGIFGIACVYAGIQLMYAPGSGDTIFDFIGLQFSTKQAGVASIALGAASIILTFRKVLKTVVDLGRI
jgi:internalin A